MSYGHECDQSRPSSRCSDAAIVLVGQRCQQCSKIKRASLSPLICSKCKLECHKSCSGLIRGEQDMFIASGSCTCEGCAVNHNSKGTDRATPMSDKPVLTTDVKIMAGLRLMQWNANGLKNNMVKLEEKTRLLEIDIILIQESKLRSSDTNTKLKCSATIRKDRYVGRGGGIVIFIK